MSTSRIVLTAFAALLPITASCHRSAPDSLPEKLHLEITGSEFEWNVRYAGRDETMGTEDDYFTRRHIALLAGTHTTIDLKSTDYLYSFALPHLGLKEIAVPDLMFSLQFSPEKTGEFTLKGDQLCGYQHPKLIGKVKVLDAEDFLNWLDRTAQQDGDPYRE